MKIRRAVEDDIPQMVDLIDERRRLYETYQPTFWRRFAECEVCSGGLFKREAFHF
jgi:hypothetical protein